MHKTLPCLILLRDVSAYPQSKKETYRDMIPAGLLFSEILFQFGAPHRPITEADIFNAGAFFFGGMIPASGDTLSTDILRKAENIYGDHYLYVHPDRKKPYLADPKGTPLDIHMSVSHSGSFIAAAFSTSNIGLDLQQITAPRPNPVTLSSRFFTPEESETIQSISDPEEQRNLFFRLWTIKESYLKYTGEGLGGGLDTFSIDLQRRTVTPITTDSPKKSEAFFHRLPAPEGYKMSLCAEAEELNTVLFYCE